MDNELKDLSREKFTCDCGKDFSTERSIIAHQIRCDKVINKVKSKTALKRERPRLTHEQRSEINAKNGAKAGDVVREKLKDPEYRAWYGSRMSEVILRSEYAIQTRKEMLSNLNKTEDFRQKSSETMAKTWAENSEMSSKSHSWQKTDREKLLATTAKSRNHENFNCFQSKPEKEIRRWLKEDLGYKLNSGRIFIDGHNRFFDIRIEDVIIEIDGPWHFESFFFLEDWSHRFKERRFTPEVDKLKEEYVLENNLLMIRISNYGERIEDQKQAILDFLSRKDDLDRKKIHKWGEKFE